MKSLIQKTFHEILCLVEGDVSRRGDDRQEDPPKINQEDIVKRTVMNTNLMGKLYTISILTESFWDDLTANKDVFSNKFIQRLFPMSTPFQNVENDPNFNVQLALENPNSPNSVGKIETYDIRSSIYKSLNTDYFDVGLVGLKNHYLLLNRSQYYEMVSQDTINIIFTYCISHKHYNVMLYLFGILACTREFYHLVMNKTICDMILSPNLPFIKTNYLEVIHYILFYAIYLMYKEECVIKAHVNPKDRCIFNLDMAARLPLYLEGIDTNPYLPISLSSTCVHATNIPDTNYYLKPLRAEGKYRGLYSTAIFKKRFQIFTDGIFEDLPMDRIYFTGSIIQACAIKNPLELLFGGPIPDRVNAYFDEYFPSKGIFPKGITIPPEVEAILSDIDIVVHVMDDGGYDTKVRMIYNHIKSIISTRLGQAPTEQELQLIKKNTAKSYKYFIGGTSLKRNLEIFRMFSKHPIGGISRFHFPAVRGLFDGNNVLVMPSLVAYAMTGLFIDYKWMSSAKDTKCLILKYFLRGCVPILNEREHFYLAEHIRANAELWGPIIEYSESSRSLSLMNPIFRPRLYGHGFYHLIYQLTKNEKDINSTKYEYINDNLSFTTNWNNAVKKSKYEFDLSLRYPSGLLRPLRLWKILAYADELLS